MDGWRIQSCRRVRIGWPAFFKFGEDRNRDRWTLTAFGPTPGMRKRGGAGAGNSAAGALEESAEVGSERRDEEFDFVLFAGSTSKESGLELQRELAWQPPQRISRRDRRQAIVDIVISAGDLPSH